LQYWGLNSGPCPDAAPLQPCLQAFFALVIFHMGGLTFLPGASLRQKSSYLCFPLARITEVHHHTWLVG
jgi:hypothetical protein